MVDKHQVFLGLGSNLHHPQQQLQQAILWLDSHPELSVTLKSKFYHSRPLGPQDQPDFVNAVVAITTSLSPLALLDVTQACEAQMGRVKKRHWGERLIDIDILLYEQQVFNSERLQIPHPQMQFRDFVLLPLHEVAPNINIPNLPSLSELIQVVDHSFLIASVGPEEQST